MVKFTESFIGVTNGGINYNQCKNSGFWKEIMNILDNRYSIMGYNVKDWNSKDGCYINQLLRESTSLIGVQVACALKAYLPIYNEKKKIYCHDIINPLQIPAAIEEIDGEWMLEKEKDSKTTTLVEDEKFLVAVKKQKKAVHIYIYRK